MESRRSRNLLKLPPQIVHECSYMHFPGERVCGFSPLPAEVLDPQRVWTPAPDWSYHPPELLCPISLPGVPKLLLPAPSMKPLGPGTKGPWTAAPHLEGPQRYPLTSWLSLVSSWQCPCVPVCTLLPTWHPACTCVHPVGSPAWGPHFSRPLLWCFIYHHLHGACPPWWAVWTLGMGGGGFA